MSSSGYISEVAINKRVHSFCQALAGRNLERLRTLLADQASLSWGPYNFEGKEYILTWAKELYELFPFMDVKEKTLEVHGSTVKQLFLIAFLTSQGQKGWIPCEGTYEFKDSQIRQLKVKLLHGFIVVNRDDIERVSPYAPRQ